MLLTVGSGYLARAEMHYSDAVENDATNQEIAACAGCVSTDQIMDAYAESLRSKMQGSLQDMIFHAGIGSRSFLLGPAFR